MNENKLCKNIHIRSATTASHGLRPGPLAAISVVLLLAGCALSRTQTPPGGDFTLASKNGTISLSDYRGKVALIYFGYITCADICPASLSLIAAALRGLNEQEKDRATGIFITVDPERDTADIVTPYATQFDPRIVGLTGRLEEIQNIAGRYGVYFKKTETGSAMGYSVDHTSATYVVDTQGHLVKVLPHGSSASMILGAVRENLR